MIFCFVLVGLLVGVLAGLFGMGGGLIVVPTIATFMAIYKPEFASNTMHIAVATSLFVMIFTSLATTYAHHKARNIMWNVALKLKIGLVFGTIFGATVASYLSGELLKFLFIIFLIYTIIKWASKLLSKKSNILDEDAEIMYPSSKLLCSFGFITGALAVLIGIGGSVLVVPFLRHRNFQLTKAAAIAASITPFIAVFGTIIYIITGSGDTNIPAYCFGFVYLPAAVGIIIGAFIGSPLGVKLASIIPQKIQNWVYLIIIFIILLVMIF